MILSPDKDPMGLAIMDYHKGEKNVVIKVNSSIGDDDIIPAHYLFRTLDQMPEIEKMALVHCTGKVLDIGAAAGAHAIILQEMGNQVTAIDISESAVEVMKQRAVEDARCINFFDFAEDEFDTLLMLMNGIGIVGDLAKLDVFLEHARTLLKDNGQIIFDSADLIDIITEDDGSVRIDLKRDYYGEVVYEMEYRNMRSHPFKWLFIDFITLCDVAQRKGFRCEQLFADASHNAYLAKLTNA